MGGGKGGLAPTTLKLFNLHTLCSSVMKAYGEAPNLSVCGSKVGITVARHVANWEGGALLCCCCLPRYVVSASSQTETEETRREEEREREKGERITLLCR
jgi:hypothetical protein